MTDASELVERQMWQPIETAPKDGTKILVGRFVRNGQYNGRIKVDYWHEPKRDKCTFTGFGRFNPTFWPATHWMPLPPSPELQP